MNIFVTILLMMVIGGLIGGFTNFLAIKMLFRPYRAYYIGKWRVPFTPGLIPKRRDELAKQLGKMVVGHLLTPESLQKKLSQKGFLGDLTQIAQNEVSKVLDTERTLEEVLTQFQLVEGKLGVKRKLDLFVEHTYERLTAKYRNQPINKILSSDVLAKIDMKIPDVSQFIVNKGIEYFSSTEGKARVQRMLDDFLKERGMLGNMLQMFLGNSSLVDKIQPEMIKFLQNDGTADLLNTLLQKEWEKLSSRNFEEVESWLEKEKIIGALQTYSYQIINLDEMMNQAIKTLVANYKETIVSGWIPKLVLLLGEWLSDRIGTILEKIHLAQIVTEQVETFSIARLEELVLSITSSELRMITYLGFFLGAIIGLLQGILAIFI